jgi:hypothetical protein
MASADQSARAGRRSGRCGRPRSHPCRSRGTDQPVAKIVPNTQPAFARPSGELRLGRHATRGDVPAASTPSREGCLDEAREERSRTSGPAIIPTSGYATAAYIGVSGWSLRAAATGRKLPSCQGACVEWVREFSGVRIPKDSFPRLCDERRSRRRRLPD